MSAYFNENWQRSILKLETLIDWAWSNVSTNTV